jgi:two-component system nitrogen regulation response regulator GlnG
MNTLWSWIENGEGDVVISDVNMPDGDGLDLLPLIKRKRPDLPVLIVSAQNTVITAIRASELGAYEYLPKPFDLKELLSRVSKALSQGNAGSKTPKAIDTHRDLPLIGSGSAMQEVYRLVARILNTDLPTMITGESGTGKDLLAHALHDLGHRAANAFISINTARITTDEIQGMLLGGEQDVDQVPKNATLYLDEIGEMSASAQVDLLNILRTDVFKAQNYRIISSTQQSLDELVNQGVFREDLFYRLNVVSIALPPLRDRIGDIPELTQHFLQKTADNGLPLKGISPKALLAMRNAAWAGNVRELENFVSRLIVMCPEDDISESFVISNLRQLPQHRPEGASAESGKLSTSVETHIQRYFDLHGDVLPLPGLYNRIIREVELPLIALSLAATRGNQIKTAELLGINRNTLRKKIKELDIVVTRSKKMM